MAVVLMGEVMRAHETQNGAMNDKMEPVVESLDKIAVESEWNRLLLHRLQPPPLSKHAAVAVGRKMFVIGGTSPQGTLNDVEVLRQFQLLVEGPVCSVSFCPGFFMQVFHAEKLIWEPLSCWSPLSDLKLTRGDQRDAHCPSCTGHSLVLWEQQFVLVGCQTGPPSKTVTVFSLDLGSRSWSTLSPKGKAPAARTGHTVVKLASMLVLFGGEDMKGRVLNDIYILDLKTLLWLQMETRGSKPSARRDHSAASYCDRYLWIFGGKSRTTYYNDMYCLDFQKMEWTKGRTKGPSPVARAGHSGAIAGKKWYIVGGESRGNEISNTVAYNLESQEWSVVANTRSGSPLANDGISLVKIQNKRKTFLVAFGGHDANLSNQIYVLLVPSTKQLGSYLAETPSDASSPRSASSNSAHSMQPVAKDILSPLSVKRTSTASSEDGMDGTPESTFSLRDIDFHSGPNGFDDQEANFMEDKERIFASQDPSTPTTANDEEALDQTHDGSYDKRQRLAEGMHLAQIVEKVPSPVSKSGDFNIKGSHHFMSSSRDLDPNTQNGTREPEVSGDLNERLSAALKLNEDLQNSLGQTQNANVELVQALSANVANTDTLEHQVLNLLMAKAEGEWKLEKSRQKLEELKWKLNSSSRPQEYSDSNSQSTSRGEQSIAQPNSLRTKLFEESIYEPETSYETQRRLDEAEIKLSALLKNQRLTESKLKTASRENRELSEKAATAMQMMEEARTAFKTLRAENLRLEHELLAVKAQLTDTQEELQTKQVELDQASPRNFELQCLMGRKRGTLKSSGIKSVMKISKHYTNSPWLEDEDFTSVFESDEY